MVKSADVSEEIAENGGWIAAAISGVVGLTNSFNFRGRDQEIELARINAEAQKSANDADRAGKNSRTIIIVGVVIAVLIMAMIFAGKKK